MMGISGVAVNAGVAVRVGKEVGLGGSGEAVKVAVEGLARAASVWRAAMV
jgi:hypothetical protein